MPAVLGASIVSVGRHDQRRRQARCPRYGSEDRADTHDFGKNGLSLRPTRAERKSVDAHTAATDAFEELCIV